MAQFPEGNPGLTPLDSASEVGQIRLLFGDTQSTPYDPPVTGQGNYTYFSDEEVSAFLAQSGGSATRAIGFAYISLAGAAAMESKSITDIDLRVDLTKRAADLRATAQLWLERADAEDDADGTNDFFDVFDLGGPDDLELIPEAMIPEYGRYYVKGRIN